MHPARSGMPLVYRKENMMNADLIASTLEKALQNVENSAIEIDLARGKRNLKAKTIWQV